MQNTQLLEAEIEDLNEQHRRKLVELDRVLIESAGDIASFIQTWAQKEADDAVKANAEKITDSDRPKLAALKADLEKFKSSARTHVTEELRDERLHIHRLEQLGTHGLQDRVSQYFLRIAQSAAQPLGIALLKSELIKPGRLGMWRMDGDKVAFKNFSPGTVIFRSSARDDLYVTGLEELCKINTRLLEAKKRLAEVKAKSLWDSV